MSQGLSRSFELFSWEECSGAGRTNSVQAAKVVLRKDGTLMDANLTLIKLNGVDFNEIRVQARQ